MSKTLFYIGDEPKSGLARDLGDCLQSRNVSFGTSGDLYKLLLRKRRGEWDDQRSDCKNCQ